MAAEAVPLLSVCLHSAWFSRKVSVVSVDLSAGVQELIAPRRKLAKSATIYETRQGWPSGSQDLAG